MEVTTQQLDSLEQRIEQVVERAFPGAEVRDLGAEEPGRRMTGVVVWEGFAEAPQIDRQNQLWRVLREQLPKQELTAVVAIMTFTPEEMAAIDADDE